MLRSRAKLSANKTLEAWNQLRKGDGEVYKKIRIDSSKWDDLDMKGCRETFGRVDDTCKYFCKNDRSVKNGDYVNIIIEFYLKNYHPL